VASSGPACVGTNHLVSVSVDNKLGRRGATKKQVVVEGALEVAKDVLRSSAMGLMRVVHVKAHLLDRTGDVRSGEGVVPESPSQTAIGRQVADNAYIGGDRGLSVN
jgi:hypothetical protein